MNDQEENQPEQPQPPEIDWTHDSVRLLSNGERIKCMVIMDVTELTDKQRTEFASRALVALTRMGQKVIGKKDGGEGRIITLGMN